MIRITLSLLIMLLFVLFGCQKDQPKKFGGEITLKEKAKVSEILSKPNEFVGKKVLVEGIVLDVCSAAGCWMDIASDVSNQKIKIKVKDGDIVFPIEAKGSSALVEGIVYSIELTEEEAMEYYKHMAEDSGKEFDSTSITGPITLYQIKGLGAEIKI